jgi:hypothetical protein
MHNYWKRRKGMNKKYVVTQYYAVVLEVEAESEEDALSMITDDDRNFYTITANMDNPDNDVKNLGVWSADIIDTEVMELEKALGGSK